MEDLCKAIDLLSKSNLGYGKVLMLINKTHKIKIFYFT